MEQDREATNLGPDISVDIAPEVQSASKQPKRRVIGQRAAAERAAAKAAQTGDSVSESSALTAIKTPRVIRTLNQIPPEILSDPDINETIALLPSNYNFEIHKTIHRIRKSGAKNVALQFPEGLLLFAPMISDILTRFCPGTDTVIMGDVTYGACCIDDYTARALGCDLLIHYGHSCLVPMTETGGIQTLYVFVTIGIDIDHLVNSISRNFQSGERIALVGTIQFNNTLHTIIPRLRELGFDPVLPRSAPLSAGEILGCTAPTLTAASTASSPQPAHTSADMVLYVGDGRFHLEAILISSPQLRAHTYRYDPYSRRLTHETYDHDEMHTLRRAAIRTARETLTQARHRQHRTPSIGPAAAPIAPAQPTTWGLILGTLGRQGNPHTLDLIRAELAHRGLPYVTLLLSEVMPGKLALMSRDVGVWVQVACPRLSIDWGYAFERPLLSPYEACVALDIREGQGWRGVEEGDGGDMKDSANDDGGRESVGVYPMDYYEKSGLGRTRVDDVPSFAGLEIEVT